MQNWFSHAHRWIVRGFEDLTSEEAQKELWGKHERQLRFLQRFARFQAARAATDTLALVWVWPLGEGSTDRYSLRQLLKLSIPFSMARGRREQTGSTAVEFSGSAPDEAPVSFEELDELRSPKGQIQDKSLRFEEAAGCPTVNALAHRLDFLLGALEEEGEIWAEGSPDSLSADAPLPAGHARSRVPDGHHHAFGDVPGPMAG